MRIKMLGESDQKHRKNHKKSLRKEWPKYTNPEGAGPGAAVGQKQEALLELDKDLAQHSMGKSLGNQPVTMVTEQILCS